MAKHPLGQGDIFEIYAVDDIVYCFVTNRADVQPSVGARCAKEMHDILLSTVLTVRGAYVGLVIDVTRGPAAFGPKTRGYIASMLSAASAVGKPIAIRVGPYTVQYLQFSSLCRSHAQSWATLCVAEKAEEWIRARAAGEDSVRTANSA